VLGSDLRHFFRREGGEEDLAGGGAVGGDADAGHGSGGVGGEADGFTIGKDEDVGDAAGAEAEGFKVGNGSGGEAIVLEVESAELEGTDAEAEAAGMGILGDVAAGLKGGQKAGGNAAIDFEIAGDVCDAYLWAEGGEKVERLESAIDRLHGDFVGHG
jgi:hypothetical protein